MSPRLERAALPKLLAHPAYRRHAKTEKLGNLASALASLVELENPPPHRDRNGSHGPTLSHNHVSVKLHHLWKCSRLSSADDAYERLCILTVLSSLGPLHLMLADESSPRSSDATLAS